MRQTLKFLHSVASCGIIGALLCYMLLLVKAPRETPVQIAEQRQFIEVLCSLLLVPSMALALFTGLVAMAVHRPFQEKRWAWVKALLGIGMFESTLAITQSKAHYAAEITRKIATGEVPADALGNSLHSEWTTLLAIMALSLGNVALGVWRPRLKARPR